MDAESPLKYPSTMQWPWSEKIHRDDRVHQNPEFFLDKEVVITEKLDGGNTCLYQGNVFARSVDSPSTAGWMAMVKKYHAWKTAPGATRFDPVLALYGEDMYGIHSIEYEAMAREETYRPFAVRNMVTDVFFSWDIVEWWAQMLGMKHVPVLFRGEFYDVDDITEWFRTHIKEPSSLGGNREGFVMRLAEEFHASEFSDAVAKYVRKNHVQTDEHWTRNWQPCKLLS